MITEPCVLYIFLAFAAGAIFVTLATIAVAMRQDSTLLPRVQSSKCSSLHYVEGYGWVQCVRPEGHEPGSDHYHYLPNNVEVVWNWHSGGGWKGPK